MKTRRPVVVRAAQLAVLMMACVLSTGCTREIVGMVDGLDFEKVLFGSSLTGYRPATAMVRMVNSSALLARYAGGAFLGLLCLYSGYKAMIGEPWLKILKDAFLGAALFGYIVTFAGTGGGLERMVYRSGMALGQRFADPEPLGTIVMQWGVIASSPVIDASEALKALSKGEVISAGARLIESIVTMLNQPWMAALMWVNVMGVWIIKVLMHTMFAFLMALHVILLPLAALTLLFPPTRYIFSSFMKSFGAMALVPMLFAILESLVRVLPIEAAFGPHAVVGSVILRVLAAQIAFVIVNFCFFTAMTGAIGFAYGIMFGAVRPLKAGVMGV